MGLIQNLKKTNLESKFEIREKTKEYDTNADRGDSQTPGRPAVGRDGRRSGIGKQIPVADPVPCRLCGIPFAWQDVYDVDGLALHCWECDPPPVRPLIQAGWLLACEGGDRSKAKWVEMDEDEFPGQFRKRERARK